MRAMHGRIAYIALVDRAAIDYIPLIDNAMRHAMLRIYVESPEGDLEGFADDCQDLDGTFVLITDDGERFNVNGWCCHVEIVDNYPERI